MFSEVHTCQLPVATPYRYFATAHGPRVPVYLCDGPSFAAANHYLLLIPIPKCRGLVLSQTGRYAIQD